MPIAIDPQRIRDQAYVRWQERGCPQDSAEQDWLEAEQALLREEAGRGAPPATAARRGKPPRPTLERAPRARAAKLSNKVARKAPPQARAQAPAAAPPTLKRTAGSR